MGIDFHPLASGVAVTFDAGKTIKIWDVEAQASKAEVGK
jgi:hypothetical protein